MPPAMESSSRRPNPGTLRTPASSATSSRPYLRLLPPSPSRIRQSPGVPPTLNFPAVQGSLPLADPPIPEVWTLFPRRRRGSRLRSTAAAPPLACLTSLCHSLAFSVYTPPFPEQQTPLTPPVAMDPGDPSFLRDSPAPSPYLPGLVCARATLPQRRSNHSSDGNHHPRQWILLPSGHQQSATASRPHLIFVCGSAVRRCTVRWR